MPEYKDLLQKDDASKYQPIGDNCIDLIWESIKSLVKAEILHSDFVMKMS